MDKKPESRDMTGLQFFGQLSASISHEIKNVLAIINENAGLLEDLSIMADRDRPIDPVRIKAMAEKIQKQVGRADGIIKNMNLFAHSIDQTDATVDLAQTIELCVALTARLVAMKGAKVSLQLPENSVKYKGAPFFLMNLVWQCLDFSLSASGAEKQVVLAVEETANHFQIQFRGLAGVSQAQLERFPSDREKRLLEILAADLMMNPARQEIVLRLTK